MMGQLSFPRLFEAENAFAGRSSFEGEDTDRWLSIAALSIAAFYFVFKMVTEMDMSLDERVTATDRLIYVIGVSSIGAFAAWIFSVVLLKMTFRRSLSTALLGLISVVIANYVLELVLDIALLTMRWDIIWSNRVLTLLGAKMTEAMTQDYIPSENWRLWPIVYITWALMGAAYGTSTTTVRSFAAWFAVVTAVIFAYATNPQLANYSVDSVRNKLVISTILAVSAFGLSRAYSIRSEEYKINRLKRVFAILAVADFFLAILIMDPPEWLQAFASYCSNIPLVGDLLSPLTSPGVPASVWGGLFVNIIVAMAGCVLGLVVGIFLAFGRQSKLPVVKWPSVSIIEIVRSGPLICWLYFAMYLLPDVVDPLFTNPEDFDNILRMMAIFSIFGGVYIAEVIRGGLQAVDSGQKEAALALGLSPIQTKRLVELPNAIRTTLPSIVSVFIGLWKDTTLLFIINILDFFKLAKDMPNTDLSFLGYFLEPLYFSAVVFWVFAFYLSRISMSVERSLGLVKEGGGDKA